MRPRRVWGMAAALAAMAAVGVSAQNAKWNFPGLAQVDQKPQAAGAGAPAPKRDLSGIWDAGFAGIAPRGHQAAPLTPWGEEVGKTHHSEIGRAHV